MLREFLFIFDEVDLIYSNISVVAEDSLVFLFFGKI